MISQRGLLIVLGMKLLEFCRSSGVGRRRSVRFGLERARQGGFDEDFPGEGRNSAGHLTFRIGIGKKPRNR